MMKTALHNAKTLRAIVALIVGSTLVLSGCQTIKGVVSKRDNGSLDYQQSQKIAPLQLPVDQDTAPFVPLYSTPTVGANTLTLQNESGKQYQLPRPERAITVTTTASQ